MLPMIQSSIIVPATKFKFHCKLPHFKFTGQQRVEVGWTSFYKGPLTLYWIDNNGNRVYTNTINPGEKGSYWSQSVLGHKFEITDTATDELVGTYITKFDSFFVIGNNFKAKVERNVTQQVAETLEGEYGKAHQVKRTFTELGFSIGKLPGDLWGSISAYYYNNQMNKMREEWDSKGKESSLMKSNRFLCTCFDFAIWHPKTFI